MLHARRRILFGDDPGSDTPVPNQCTSEEPHNFQKALNVRAFRFSQSGRQSMHSQKVKRSHRANPLERHWGCRITSVLHYGQLRSAGAQISRSYYQKDQLDIKIIRNQGPSSHRVRLIFLDPLIDSVQLPGHSPAFAVSLYNREFEII